MKAIDYLKWHLDSGIDAGASSIIDVDKDLDFESFFGYKPDCAVPYGKYVYLYSDMVLESDMSGL